MSVQGETTDHPSSAAPPVASPGGAADVMQVLAEFETGLTSLKALYLERQAIQERLAVRESDLAGQQGAIDLRRVELENLATRVEAGRIEIQERAAQAEAAAAQARSEIAQSRADCEAARAELDSQRAELASLEAENQRTRSDLDRSTQELTAQTTALEQARREWEIGSRKRDTELGERALRAEELQAEIERDRAAIERRQGELIARQKRLEEASNAQAEAARAAERSALARASELEGLQADIAGESELLRRSRSECAARQSALDLRERTLREAELQQSELATAATQSAHALSEARADSDVLKTRTAEVFQEYESLLAAERAECVRATLAESSLAVDVERLAAAIETLRARLAESRESEETLVARIAFAGQTSPAGESAAGVSAPAWSAGRPDRLRKYRDMVRAHALKVRKASEGLSKRFEQCEQVLSHRADLAAIRDRVLEADRKSQRRHAGGRAVISVFCGVLGFSLLAGLAWAIAREVAPARFMAESILVAEGRGRDLNPAERAEWQRYHESLIRDPMFHEAAAERFKRHGSTELATPAAISELVTASVRTESLADGELRVRLSGEGADRTARTLDTFSAALASFANGSQQRRIDGGATRISREAEAGDTPIDNVRTFYALGILGAGAAISLGATLGLWRRLSRAKSEFEQDEQVAMTLEEARWINPSRRG